MEGYIPQQHWNIEVSRKWVDEKQREREALIKIIHAAYRALRSYQHGEASGDLA